MHARAVGISRCSPRAPLRGIGRQTLVHICWGSPLVLAAPLGRQAPLAWWRPPPPPPSLVPWSSPSRCAIPNTVAPERTAARARPPPPPTRRGRRRGRVSPSHGQRRAADAPRQPRHRHRIGGAPRRPAAAHWSVPYNDNMRVNRIMCCLYVHGLQSVACPYTAAARRRLASAFSLPDHSCPAAEDTRYHTRNATWGVAP